MAYVEIKNPKWGYEPIDATSIASDAFKEAMAGLDSGLGVPPSILKADDSYSWAYREALAMRAEFMEKQAALEGVDMASEEIGKQWSTTTATPKDDFKSIVYGPIVAMPEWIGSFTLGRNQSEYIREMMIKQQEAKAARLAEESKKKSFFGVDADLIYSVLPGEFQGVDFDFHNLESDKKIKIKWKRNGVQKVAVINYKDLYACKQKRDVLRILVQAILKAEGMKIHEERPKPVSPETPLKRRIFID
jgi:hypothetical protein